MRCTLQTESGRHLLSIKFDRGSWQSGMWTGTVACGGTCAHDRERRRLSNVPVATTFTSAPISGLHLLRTLLAYKNPAGTRGVEFAVGLLLFFRSKRLVRYWQSLTATPAQRGDDSGPLQLRGCRPHHWVNLHDASGQVFGLRLRPDRPARKAVPGVRTAIRSGRSIQLLDQTAVRAMEVLAARICSG